MSSLLLGARKEASEDASGSGKRTPPPGGSATAAAREATPGVQSPKVAAAGAIKPARDRLTFFSSLRRKTSGGELMGSGEHGHLVRQVGRATFCPPFRPGLPHMSPSPVKLHVQARNAVVSVHTVEQ